jgi:hypothetical protein
VNVRDAEWWFAERRGEACNFESEEGDPPVEFVELGINVTILQPGPPQPLPRRIESRGVPRPVRECRLLVEGEE